MLDIEQLRALHAAVDEGTFDAAARKLHITPSAVSQRIKALERAVGRILLQRTKPVQVTDSGREVLRLARQIDALSRDTMRELGLDNEQGSLARISVAVNADSLSTWVLQVLADFTAEASFDFHLDDQDHTTDLLRDGSVMAAVTSAATPIQGCTSSRLGIMRYRPMASVEFCDRWFSDGVTAEALSAAPVVVFNRKDLLQDRYLRRKVGYPVDPPRHQVPSSAGFSDAVRLGYGWGLLPDLQSHESAYALIGFDPNFVYDVPLFWQQWKLSPPILVRIADAVAARAQEILPQSSA